MIRRYPPFRLSKEPKGKTEEEIMTNLMDEVNGKFQWVVTDRYESTCSTSDTEEQGKKSLEAMRKQYGV